jgi:SAM-dependent methyltransferase
MKSLPYKIPRLYEIGVRILLGKTVSLRYSRIAQEIGSNKKVFDLGCGTGMLYSYLDSCTYTGWDLNDSFVRYCQKKGLNVHKKDIFKFSEYPKCDYIVCCDILHHVIPKDELLLREAVKRATVIATEPCSQRRLPQKLVFLYDQVIGDADGINTFCNRMQWTYTKDTLKQKFVELGASKIEFLDGYVFAVFNRKFLNR